MSSKLPPPPPPKPPRLQMRRQPALLPCEMPSLPRDAMESTEYLDVQKKLIAKQMGQDEVDRVVDQVNASVKIRAEPVRIVGTTKSGSLLVTDLDQVLTPPKITRSNSHTIDLKSEEIESIEMQIEEDDESNNLMNEKLISSVCVEDETENSEEQLEESNDDEEEEEENAHNDDDEEEEEELDDEDYSEYFDAKQQCSNAQLDNKSSKSTSSALLDCDGLKENQLEQKESSSKSKSEMFEIEDEKLLDHLRMRNPELLPKLIKMHLLMLLDLNGDTFASIFEESSGLPDEGKRLGTIKRRKHESKNQDKTIFQQALTEEGICRIYLLIDFIGKDSNINQEGIFRKCGSAGRQQELKYKLQQQTHIPLDGGEYTVHDCSNVLKACLSELPEPLLSERFYKLICQYSQLSLDNQADLQSTVGQRQLKVVQLILLLLPEQRKKFACDLLSLLKRVGSADNSRNLMDARSLATLFAPHLLCPRALSPSDLQKAVSAMTNLLEFLITNVQLVFKAPAELLLDVRRALAIKVDDNDADCVRTAYTFCQPEHESKESTTVRNSNTTNEPDVGAEKPAKSQYTQRHVAELYAYVQQMPDSPHKRRLVKQFNRQNGGLTPQPDKENNAKRKPGARVAIRLMGDKLRAMRNKVTVGGKGLLGGSRRTESANDLDSIQSTAGPSSFDDMTRTRNPVARKLSQLGPNGRARSRSSDDLLEVWDPCEEANEIHEAAIDVPLGEMTATRFCIEDDDHLTESPSNKQINKKRVRAASADDILIDVPYASESIFV